MPRSSLIARPMRFLPTSRARTRAGLEAEESGWSKLCDNNIKLSRSREIGLASTGYRPSLHAKVALTARVMGAAFAPFRASAGHFCSRYKAKTDVRKRIVALVSSYLP